MDYYVDANVFRSGDGDNSRPFKTISEAAAIARPGDTVFVAPGVYREHVNPANAGTENARISYISEKQGEAVITGLANMLISMSDEYKIEGKEGSIVSPLHCDITVDKIRRYVYFYHFLCNENQTVNLNVRLLRSKDDKGKTYREIISNNKEFEDLINIILYNKASNLNERYEEAKRKIEESSRRYRNTHGY